MPAVVVLSHFPYGALLGVLGISGLLFEHWCAGLITRGYHEALVVFNGIRW